MKFLVNIEEVICENFEIEAETVEEALEIVKRAYNSGEIVLEPGGLISTSASVYDEKSEEWSEKLEL